MLNNFAENGGFNNNHGQAARPAEAQKPQNIASSWGYNTQLEGMYYGGEHQPMYMGAYGSGAKHPNYSQYPSSSIHQPVPTPVVKCMEACCQHYPINPAPLRYHQANAVHGDTRQYMQDRRTMQSTIPRKKVYPTENIYSGIPERHYPQYIGRGPALNVADPRQQMPMIRPQYPIYPSSYLENRNWVGPRVNCPPSYHQSVNQSAQLQTGLKIPDGSHYMDPNAQKISSSQHRRVVNPGSGGTEIIRPIPEPKRQVLDHNPQSCYEYGYPTGFLPFNDVNKIQNGNLPCQNSNTSYKMPSDKQYHPHQMQYSIPHNERNVINHNTMYDLNYPMNYPLLGGNDSHLRPESGENQHLSDSRKYDGSLGKKRPDLDLRQYLATWDDDEDEGTRASETLPVTNSVAPYVVVDGRSLETDTSGKLQERLGLKPQDSPAKGKDNSPIVEQLSEDQPIQNHDSGRSEIHQTNYAPSMPTLLSDLDKNTTLWNGISGEGVIGKGGAFQPLDCSKREVTFENQKRDSHSENLLHKLPVHTNDTTNLSFDNLAPYYNNENRRLETYNNAEVGSRIVKNPDTTTSNYHHVQPPTNVSRPCDPRLQQSQGNTSIYSKVAPKYPSTNNYDPLKPNPTDGYYNYKHPMANSKYFGYENSIDSNYDYHKYIPDLDSVRPFENKDTSKDPRRMYQDVGKSISGPFIEPYSKTSDSSTVSENLSYGLDSTRAEPFMDANSKDNEVNHQLSPFQANTHSPGDEMKAARKEGQSFQEKTVLVTSQSGPAEIFRMPFSPEKDISHKDNVVTLHSADQAKDNAITVEVPYVQQYSTLVRLSEEISQTERDDIERGAGKSDDSNNKIVSNEELKKPASLKIKRLPNSEEWTVEENNSNLVSTKKSTNTFESQSNESLDKINIGSLNMPSLDDIRDGEENGDHLTNKFTEGTVCLNKTAHLEDVIKTKHVVQAPQMAIVQPMKLLEPQPECLDTNLIRKNDNEKEISFKKNYSSPYDLNQNNFDDKVLLNDIQHSKQSNFSKHEVSKHENFRTHKKIQRSISDCFGESFIHSEDKVQLQSYSDCEVDSNMRGYYKIGEENATEEKCLNSRIPSSPGVDGMFEDINHSDKDLLYRRKSCDYQETISHEIASLNSDNHFQSFSNMFIDDTNKRARADGSVLQMSDRKCSKSQIDDIDHQDLSKSFEEHVKKFKSNSENRVVSPEKLVTSKKSPSIPPISLKLIESKKIWCITNKEQHLNQSNFLYENSLDSVNMCLDLNQVETEQLEGNSNIIEKQYNESLSKECMDETLITTKVNEDNDKHCIVGNFLDAHVEKRSSNVTRSISESETSQLLVTSDFDNKSSNSFISSSPQCENKCLSVVKYYPPNKLIGEQVSSDKQGTGLKIFVFDEKGNHFPEVSEKAQEQRTESEAVVFDILNDILTKSVHNSSKKVNIESSHNRGSDFASDTEKPAKHETLPESVIKFDTSKYNKMAEKLTDPIAKTTEKFILHEKENYQHYSVIKMTQLEVANCLDLQRSYVRSIFSPMPEVDKCREEHPNQSRCSQNGKVSISQTNEITQMDVDNFEGFDNMSNSQGLENDQDCVKGNDNNANSDTSKVSNPMITNDVRNTTKDDNELPTKDSSLSSVKINTLLCNTEELKAKNSRESIPGCDGLYTTQHSNYSSESLASQRLEEKNQCGEQPSPISTNLNPTLSSIDDSCRNIVVINQTDIMQVEEDNLPENGSKNVCPEIESVQNRNPLDNDLALSPESSSSDSMESEFSDDCKTPKDDEKHQTDCSSDDDDEMEDTDDFLVDNHLDNCDVEPKSNDLLSHPVCQVDAANKQELMLLEDRSKTSVIVRNNTCNSVLLHDEQDYRMCFDCNDSAMPIDCSMKSIGGKNYEPDTNKIRIEHSQQQNIPPSNVGPKNNEINISQKYYRQCEDLTTERNLKCENAVSSRETSKLSSVSKNATSNDLILDEHLKNVSPDTEKKDSGGDLESLSKKTWDQFKNENKMLYCTNEHFFYSSEERTTLKETHSSYTHFFKKRKWQKFINVLDGSESISNKLNDCLEKNGRNFSIINFGNNTLQLTNLPADIENQHSDLMHDDSNQNLTTSEGKPLFSTHYSSVATLNSFESETQLGNTAQMLTAGLVNEVKLNSSNVSENKNNIQESNSRHSSDTEMESCLPLDSIPFNLTNSVDISRSGTMSRSIEAEANKFDKEDSEITFQKENSSDNLISERFDGDSSNLLSTTLPNEDSLVTGMSKSPQKLEVNCHLKNNETTEQVSDLNQNSTDVEEHKDEDIKEDDKQIQIAESKFKSFCSSIFVPDSTDVTEKKVVNCKESSKFRFETHSTNESLHSWNDSESSISYDDSQSYQDSVDFVLPKTTQPLVETTVGEELIQSTIHNSETNIEHSTESNSEEILTSSANNNHELLNESFSEMSNYNSSTEICQETNVDQSASEEMTLSIVTGKDVLFSSRFLHDEEEQFSNSELDPTIKGRKSLPEDDDDHDVRTDAIKESLRNNQTLSTETFPLQCLVEAALALENVDSKQILLNNTPLSDSYCQTADRFLKMPEAEILSNCFDEPSEEEKAIFNKSSMPINQKDSSLTLSDKEVFSKFEETNYNFRASTRIVTSSSSNIIPYSKRKYCFKSKLNKNNSELKQKAQTQIKEKNRPKKRKGFFSYPRSKKRKRMTKGKQKSIPVPLQDDFDDDNVEIGSEKELAKETSKEKLVEEQGGTPDQFVKCHSDSDFEDKAVIDSMVNSNTSPYFTTNNSENGFGGPLIIASNGNTSSEDDILCVQVNPQKIDSFSHDLNEELDSITGSQSLFKESKTVIESDMTNVALGSSTSLVIIIEDLENIAENKSSFEDQNKRDSDFIFGSVEDCTISQSNSVDCSTMLTTEMSVNESCICPPHYSLNGICENGLNKEKARELLESEHFISNTFINIEDTSYRKYSSCSSSELLATNCYEEINEDDISNWPFVEEEVAEFETNPDPSNTIPENGRKIELKCSLPWKKIFNISKTKKKKSKTSKTLTGLELGPANVEVRLKAPSSEWKVIGDYHETSSPVVKVSRLILQRESETSSYSEKDSEEENENKSQQNSCCRLQDVNGCNSDHTFVKDVINDDLWQPVVLLTRNKVLDELNLSLDSKSSGKEMFSPHNMSPNNIENYQDCLKELQSSLQEVQSKESFSSFIKEATSSFSSDDSFVEILPEDSANINDLQGRKIKISSYGTYSPSADNNASTNDIPYSPSDPHFSPKPSFPHSNESTVSKESLAESSSSCIDEIFEESYENTRLSSYFKEAFKNGDKETEINVASDKHSFLNETVDNSRSGFFNNGTIETSQSSFEVQTSFLNDLSAVNESKENYNLHSNKDVDSTFNNPSVEENQHNVNEPKNTSYTKTSCDNSVKVRRKMPKNFFVRRKIRKQRVSENIDVNPVLKTDPVEFTLWRKSVSCTNDPVQNKVTDNCEVDQETHPLSVENVGTSTRDELSVTTDNHLSSCDQPTNKPSPECENSRLQCVYDLDESSPVSQHEFPPSERFEQNPRLRDGGRGLKRPCEGHSKEDTKRRRKKSRSRSSCSECELQFDNKEELSKHNSSKHSSRRRELHHCLLCQRTFSSYRRHRLHIQGRSHRHLELTQRSAALTMYRRLTGRDCPLLPPLSLAEQRVLHWRPTQTGYSHFYHAPTPLQALLQEQSSETTAEQEASEERSPND